MGFLKRLWRGGAPWWQAFFVAGFLLAAIGALAIAINAYLIYRHYAPEAVFNMIWNPLLITLSLAWWWINFQTFRRSAKKVLPAIALAVVSLNAVFITYGVYYTNVNGELIAACSDHYDSLGDSVTEPKSQFITKCIKASRVPNEQSQ